MKKTTALLALALIVVGALAQAIPPELLGRKLAILTAATATSTCDSTTAVRSTGLPKTYQAGARVAGGTGTAVVTVRGSMDASAWTDIVTITIPMTSATAPVTGAQTSDDHFAFVCGAVTTLSGSTPTLSLSVGY